MAPSRRCIVECYPARPIPKSSTGGNSLKNKNLYDAWMMEEHAESFGAWDKFSTAKLVRICDQFNECQALRDLAKQKNCHTLSDIGCATGSYYRYIREIWPAVHYKGFDISEAAITRVRKRHPKGEFQVSNDRLPTVEAAKSDVIFCRDVVHHQEDPKTFLEDLYHITGKYLVLRVRTREEGETVFDHARSCQYTYGRWVPYIVFQTRQLINLFRSFDPPPVKIDVMRHPLVLGGRLSRYLPKELYYPETGTAESAVVIQKGSKEVGLEPTVSIEARPETPRLAIWPQLAKTMANRLGL